AHPAVTARLSPTSARRERRVSQSVSDIATSRSYLFWRTRTPRTPWRHSMRSKLLTAAAAAAALGSAGPAVVAHARAMHPAGARITAHSSRYGTVIFTGQNRSIYLFARDHRKSSCYGACAKAWPPVLTTGKPRAGAGVRAKLLGTVRRTDGTLQVTYG